MKWKVRGHWRITTRKDGKKVWRFIKPYVKGPK
jgi:hypothetical protein